MTLLDLRFPKVVALMNSTQHAGEQKAAKRRAEAMAAAAGMTLAEAAATDKTPTPEGYLDGFDDHMKELILAGKPSRLPVGQRSCPSFRCGSQSTSTAS